MSPEVSRACARLKSALQMPPGPQLDALIAAAEKADSIEELPEWIKTGLRKIDDTK